MPTRTLALLLLATFFTPAVFGQTIFHDSFEESCLLDNDNDRLMNCEEPQYGTLMDDPDTDDDGLLDGDEALGTLGGLDLPALGANPRHKDIFIEYDWFEDSIGTGSGTCGSVGPHPHRPSQESLDIVTNLFASAPIENPDGLPGISVIHDAGQGGLFNGGSLVPDPDGEIIGTVFDAEYDSFYETQFAQNRHGYFHYVLMPHRFISPQGTTTYSGNAEIYGPRVDEIIVSLQCSATTSFTGNTIAHELGHNLRLLHGGDTGCNWKPNYKSIMNYRYQFYGVSSQCENLIFVGPAEFSTGSRIPLDEGALLETSGMCGSPPIDWNTNGTIESGTVAFDVNYYQGQSAECGSELSVLTDHDDWASLDIPIDEPPDGSGGSTPPLGTECAPPPYP